MNRHTRTVVVLIVALMAATVASFGVYQAVQARPVREVEVPAAYVAAAASPLPMGVRLTREQVKLVAWPAKSPVGGTFASIEEVVGRGLVAGVAENEPITEAKLAPASAGAGLSPAIRPGMRAMSVRVNEVIGVAGFVVPGARVDVLVTIRAERAGMARVVVSDVEVLTAGTRYDQTESLKDGKPIPTSVVTVMVLPGDAERIALAATEGQIMLALRNPLDTEATQTSGIRTTDLMGGTSGAPSPAPSPAPRAPRPVVRAAVAPVATVAPASSGYTVEIIRGGKRDQESVQ